MIYGYQRSAHFIAFLTGTIVLAASARGADHVPSRSWWAFEADGDKPGNGFVVIERGGKVENTHFFIFLPDSPEDQSGRFIQMSHIKQDGKVLLAELKGLEEPEGTVAHLRIEFRDGFDAGKRIRAVVTDPDLDRSKQRAKDMVFVLQGDQWDGQK